MYLRFKFLGWFEKSEEQTGTTATSCSFAEESFLAENEQVKCIEILTEQMEQAVNEQKDVIMLGDANVCSQNWNIPNSKKKKVADEIINALDVCGMYNIDMGITYTADGIGKSGQAAESGLDHIYVTKSLKARVETKKKESAGTDHRPIIAEIKKSAQIKNNTRVVVKRNMRNFNKKKLVSRPCKAELGRTW